MPPTSLANLLIVATGWLLGRAGRSMRLGTVLFRLQDTTAEIRVRLTVLLLVGLVVLAEYAGLEAILGAFLAGVLVGLVDRDTVSHPHFRAKLDAISFGFLVPVFFVASGARLDLGGLLEQPSALLRVPAFLIALLLVRGLPAVLYRRGMGWRETAAAGGPQEGGRSRRMFAARPSTIPGSTVDMLSRAGPGGRSRPTR